MSNLKLVTRDAAIEQARTERRATLVILVLCVILMGSCAVFVLG